MNRSAPTDSADRIPRTPGPAVVAVVAVVAAAASPCTLLVACAAHPSSVAAARDPVVPTRHMHTHAHIACTDGRMYAVGT
jgi:hypothetical protein